jgi:ABC-2 type transport system ATP-binding protein
LLQTLGKVVSNDHAMAILQVSQDAVSATVSRALAHLPVKDLTVENPPLEEVMSELFAGNHLTGTNAETNGKTATGVQIGVA